MKHVEVTWTFRDFSSLDYRPLGGFGSKGFEHFVHETYRLAINNAVYDMPDPMPGFVHRVLDQLNFAIKAVSFNRMAPGNILPLHCDRYTSFMRDHNVDDVNGIYRFIVFLESSKSGHLMQIGRRVYAEWAAGDYVGWRGSTLHAAYNLGIEDRYTMQITCFGQL